MQKIDQADGDNFPVDPLRYRDYVALVGKVLRDLRQYYASKEHEISREEESMTFYAQKFYATTEALRFHYLYSPHYRLHPCVDLTDSGFPNFTDISQLDADLAVRGESLQRLPETETLKSLLIEHLMSLPAKGMEELHKEQEMSYLWQITERKYLESLDLRVQFFQFTPGKAFLLSEEEYPKEKGRRAYVFSWGCYDRMTNRPYVYFMLMTQDENDLPLDAPDNPDYGKFLDTVRFIAARAPADLVAVALRLDESFKTLYVKALKRFCVGPLVSPLLYNRIGECKHPDQLSMRLMPHFDAAGIREDDYVLLFSTEFVHSVREVMPERLFSLGKQKVTQIFHEPGNQPSRQTYALMHHRLRQHLSEKDLANIPELVNATFLIYSNQTRGEILNVG